LDNGIPILNFENDKNDIELLYLIKYLMMIKDFEDVREYNKNLFKFSKAS